MRRVSVLSLAVVLTCLAISAALGQHLHGPRLNAARVAPPPAEAVLRLQGLGDDQAVFRAQSLRLQHLGNLGGRIVPFRDLDYAALADWLRTLDGLDARAKVVPSMAAFLFSGTPVREDVRHLVTYLADHARRDPGRAWRWMTHAVYLARYKLRDDALALDLAEELAAFQAPAMPDWARHMRILVLRGIGRVDAARALVTRLLEDGGEIAPAERRWLRFYLERELN